MRGWLDGCVSTENFFLKERSMTRDKTAMLEKEVLHLKQLIGELKRTDTDGAAGEGHALLPHHHHHRPALTPVVRRFNDG
jgi:hypothetical protein